MDSFIERVTPAAMQVRFKELCAVRSDLRVLLYMLGHQRCLEWVHSVGVCEDKHLRSLVPPFPPSQLRSVTAAPDLPEFLWTGLVDFELVMRLFTEVPGPITADQPVILDFGCGCGRMLRFMNNLSGVWSVHGCDVNLHHVRWCQSNLNSIQTAQCSPQPPLPYDDEVFNLVYALSVFSHLSEFNAALWLEELRRVLRPGGVAILTTHGVPALEIIRDSEAHQHMFGLDRQSIIEILSQFKERSFVFQRYSNDVLRNANAGEEYGNTFIHPDYLFQKWDAAGLRVLRHIPGGVRGWQDIVVLQKHASK